ncbi:MAG: cupredoxin domain-containing protein [Myxococcales bacterium]|nr:cupredoxin domain-containing protein [Myxococcales bacterium]
MRLVFVLTLASLLACTKAEPKAKAKPQPAPVTAGTIAADGSRAIPITVKKAGYEPDSIQAKPNEKLTLVFTRVEDTQCGAQVKVAGGAVHDLPMNQPVEIAVTAPASGEVQFACGMDMMSGLIVVGS